MASSIVLLLLVFKLPLGTRGGELKSSICPVGGSAYDFTERNFGRIKEEKGKLRTIPL